MSVQWNGAAWLAERKRRALQGGRKWMEEVKKDSDKMCPKESGKLVSTGKITVDEAAGTVTLSYGDESTPYVLPVYFDELMRHAAGEEAHWAEKAIEAHRSELPGYINGG